MRAVAYTEALQTLILVLGSLLLTDLRAAGPRRVGRAAARSLGSEMFNLWKPLMPAGVEGTWAPVKEAGRMAWYFNGNYPWLGMLFCAPIIGLWYWCTDQYIVQRALGAPNEREARRGTIFAALPQAAARVHLHHSGHDRARAGQERPGRRACGVIDRRPAQAVPSDGAGRVPADGAARAATGRPRHRRGRAAGGPHELAGRRLQRLLDAVHDGLLPEVPARARRSTAGVGRPHRHRGDGADRPAVDSRHPGRRGLYDYLQGVQGYLAPPIVVGVLPRRLQEADERARAAWPP